ncbi:MAG: class A beta-lactamase-related serine hydrolase [Gemmatimonadales bacterium]|nr:MAG: class A beta-lactamase-related serine hydrolase [Gemmatimonadales bacterium]
MTTSIKLPGRVPSITAILACLLVSACASGTPGVDEDRIHRVATGLVPAEDGAPTASVEERLEHHGVPGVSVAVIEEGELLWARGWGEAADGVPVTPETLFQAASISKPVMAVGALRLVEDGVLSLDSDVNEQLQGWQVPDSPFTYDRKVSLRGLLSHSAGLTVHGFPGYAEGAEVPSLVQLLDGASPANTAPVRVDTIPGDLWRYSGGGSSVVQLLMTEVTGLPFPELMDSLVLGPLGMERSTFQQPLPRARHGEAATAHGANGEAVPGRFHTYPEKAAAGLWTTPSDLARLAIELQRLLAGASDGILQPETVREMLTLQAGEWGLGFTLREGDGHLWFSHGGANRGFRATFLAMAHEGRGVVVMTNSDAGMGIANEIVRAVAREYGWPSYGS